MKLNADIIFDTLKTLYKSEKLGLKTDKLHLERPEIYMDGEKKFLTNHLYIASAEHLPYRPIIEKDVVIVCTGNFLGLSYYLERCCFISIQEKTNFFYLFNLIQQIYNRYDIWTDHLTEILNHNASIEEMIECSRGILNNPVFVLDSNFQYLAHTSDYVELTPEELDDVYTKLKSSGSLSLPALGKFLEYSEPTMCHREPVLINLLGSSTLNINLFEKDEYIGCMTVVYQNRSFNPSDKVIANYLAEMIHSAIQKFTVVPGSEKSILRQALREILEGIPSDPEHQRFLEIANNDVEYVCVKMTMNHRFDQLPMGYLCNMIESAFQNGIAFEYDDAAIAFLETGSLRKTNGEYALPLQEWMTPFIDSMDLRMGISDPFNDLYRSRLYHRQACAALENGSLLDANKRFYTFQDYALMEMIVNSQSELPLDLYHSPGIRRLIAHDNHSEVSYIDTLQTYLNQNMNITKTAKLLFVHRSTLMERISRIMNELDTDLNDPNQRLRIQILLKAIEIHEQILKKDFLS
ncbi:helix-turn-helix domain-containing protein [Eubacteriaceae bacterium ES2]|nr:helix-turn-helix domain-containing protein [Eubacteriaceae bacterium ES2]